MKNMSNRVVAVLGALAALSGGPECSGALRMSEGMRHANDPVEEAKELYRLSQIRNRDYLMAFLPNAEKDLKRTTENAQKLMKATELGSDDQKKKKIKGLTIRRRKYAPSNTQYHIKEEEKKIEEKLQARKQKLENYLAKLKQKQEEELAAKEKAKKEELRQLELQLFPKGSAPMKQTDQDPRSPNTFIVQPKSSKTPNKTQQQIPDLGAPSMLATEKTAPNKIHPGQVEAQQKKGKQGPTDLQPPQKQNPQEQDTPQVEKEIDEVSNACQQFLESKSLEELEKFSWAQMKKSQVGQKLMVGTEAEFNAMLQEILKAKKAKLAVNNGIPRWVWYIIAAAGVGIVAAVVVVCVCQKKKGGGD